MDNRALAGLLDELAELESFQGANPFKVRAYRNAAETLRDLDADAATLHAAGTLGELPGIGPAIVEKVGQALETGTIEALERARAAVDINVATLSKLPGLGPKGLLRLRDELGVRTLEDLEAALARGTLTKVKGIGPKLEGRIREALPVLKAGLSSLRLDLAQREGRRLADGLEGGRVLGEVRRWEALCDGLVLASSAAITEVRPVLEARGASVTVGLEGLSAQLGHVPVACHTIDPGADGTRIVELTGTSDHVAALEARAAERGLDWAAWRGSEEALYEALGLPFIAPEVRVDGSEIALAEAGGLEALVTREALQGDLQSHTTWSDGVLEPPALARAAAARGHRYLGVTDHAGALPIAGAMSGADLERYAQDVREAGDAAGIRVLAGAEVEAGRTGELTVPDAALEHLDYVAAGIHQGLDLPPEHQTARYLAVVEHPLVAIVVHPMGRKVDRRPGARLDWVRVFEAAADHDVAMEIDANPVRNDLPAPLARKALAAGCRLVISSDAHAADELDHLVYGVMTARKALAPAERVINTWDIERLAAFLRRG